jgi:hypothetical protein
MLNGWSRSANNPNSRYGYKSPSRRFASRRFASRRFASRRFAQLIDSKYGKVIDAPNLVE